MGNPQFDCADLKQATTELSLASGHAPLVATAEMLLDGGAHSVALVAAR
jgi:hypothetical protein